MNPKRASYSITRLLLVFTILGVALHASGRPAGAAMQFDIIGPPGSVHFGTSVTVLPNGNVVVTDPDFDSGMATQAGAVYLYNGDSGALISTLTGSTAGDQVGSGGVTVLSNGNYAVISPAWDNAAVVDAGAVTWGNGANGIIGIVSAANSLVGSAAGDQVGSVGVTALSNGNYVVNSYFWNNAGIALTGAVTWGSGSGGLVGLISAANSLVGDINGDQAGSGGVTALSNGNYVVKSPLWDNGAIVDIGAATWGNGTTGIVGTISAAQNLLGSTGGDQVGSGGVTALSNGNYVVLNPLWDNSAIVNAGAVTWASSVGGVFGSINAQNSVRGTAASGGGSLIFQFDSTNRQLVVGRLLENLVTLLRLPQIFLPVVSK